MAISTRKKNLIIAEWKAGKYKSAYAVSKAHKISDKTAKKIIAGIQQENADIVEAGVMYESAKKSVKNPIEINAIESVVNDRIKIQRISNTILDGVENLLNGGKAKKVVVESMGTAGSSATIVEYDLQAKDYKELQETVDKASLTLGVNQRHANNNIQVNTQNNVKNEMVEVNEDTIKTVIKELIGES